MSDAEAPRLAARPSEDELAVRMQIAGALSCGLAHHLNNSVATIYVACASLRETCADDADAKASIDLVEGAADHARDVVSALTGFVRPAAAGPAPVHVQHLVERALLLLRPALHGGVDLQVECPAEPVLWLRAEAHRLQQVIFTLALRGEAALPAGGALRVAVGLAPRSEAAGGGDVVRVRIESAGAAGPARPGRGYAGAGERVAARGLEIAHAIVADCGGRIEADERRAGAVRFDVLLPCTRAPAGVQRER